MFLFIRHPDGVRQEKLDFMFVIHLRTLFFHCDYDGNVFLIIQRPQDGLERRERYPGAVQQGKLMFPLWTNKRNLIFCLGYVLHLVTI